MINFFLRRYNISENSDLLKRIKFYAVVRRTIVLFANIVLPVYFRMSCLLKRKAKNEYISDVTVSLTTFPLRISKIWLVIECMMRQTIKPKRIVLWLSKEQFQCEGVLPKNLTRLKEKGLEIIFCDGNLMSHKKYFNLLSQNFDQTFITIDDDFFYPSNLIEELIEGARKFPGTIVCQRAFKITYKNNVPNNYNKWIFVNDEALPSLNTFFTSGGGTLFPANSLNSDVINPNIFMTFCKFADDVWLNAMARLNDTQIYRLNSQYLNHIPIKIFSNVELTSVNVDQNMNDQQIINLESYYQKTNKKRIFVESL